MSKKVYVGVDGVARQIKKIYAGVDGVGRNIPRGYVGVDGVARQIFGDYWGEQVGESVVFEKARTLYYDKDGVLVSKVVADNESDFVTFIFPSTGNWSVKIAAAGGAGGLSRSVQYFQQGNHFLGAASGGGGGGSGRTLPTRIATKGETATLKVTDIDTTFVFVGGYSYSVDPGGSGGDGNASGPTSSGSYTMIAGRGGSAASSSTSAGDGDYGTTFTYVISDTASKTAEGGSGGSGVSAKYGYGGKGGSVILSNGSIRQLSPESGGPPAVIITKTS